MTKLRQAGSFLLLFVLVTQSAFAAFVEEDTRKPIRINEPDWPPFFYRQPTSAGRLGIGKDVLDICLKGMNQPYEFVALPIERMQNEMQNGQLEINLYSYRKERESFVVYGKELLYETGYRPVVKVDSPIVIRTVKDFDPYKLGHTIGLRYSNEFMNYILERKKRKDLDETSTNESNLKKLLAGRIDIFVADYSSILSLAAEVGVQDKIKILDFPIHDGRYFLSISKNSSRIGNKQDFANDFDHCVRELKSSGKFCKIVQNYKIPCPKDSQ